jgi:hypothetical protein
VGRLFIANPSLARVEYTLNGGALDPGAPCNEGPEPPLLYTPFFVAAEICRYREQGVLGYGENELSAHFLDGESPCPFLFPIEFCKEEHSVDEDVIAHVFRGVLLLMNERGARLTPNPPLIPGHTNTSQSEET